MNRIVLTSALALSLAVPAVASAHPGIYTVTQTLRSPNTACSYDGTPAGDTCLTTRTQYDVANDGWARSFTEDNGLTTPGGGMINYKSLAGGWRDSMKPEVKRSYPQAQTALQAHATCSGVGLETEAAILAWQPGPDPFFDYVPWQSASALLGDEPSEWLPTVKRLMGVDLTGLTDAQAQAACTGKGGTYHKADTPTSVTDAQIAAATAPLQSQITTLQSGVAAVTAQFNAADAARRALVARPLTLKLSGRNTGNIAMVTGATGTSVTLKLTVSSADRKRLKLSSATLATKTLTLDAQGAGLVTLTPSNKARKAIKKRVKVTLRAVGGGAAQTASGSYLD
jgi:hypothetical protein